MIDDELEAYLDRLAGVLGHADRRTGLKDYCRGLMLPIQRKSIEPGCAYRSVSVSLSLASNRGSLPEEWANDRALPGGGRTGRGRVRDRTRSLWRWSMREGIRTARPMRDGRIHSAIPVTPAQASVTGVFVF